MQFFTIGTTTAEHKLSDMTDNTPPSQVPDEADASRAVPWWIIAVAAGAVLFAGVVVIRTGSDLQALLFFAGAARAAGGVTC